jgi:hypothetical protein
MSGGCGLGMVFGRPADPDKHWPHARFEQISTWQKRDSLRNPLQCGEFQQVPKIVDNIASRSKRIKGNFVARELPRKSLSGLHTHIHARNMTVSSENDEFHLDEVLFGPLNLRLN